MRRILPVLILAVVVAPSSPGSAGSSTASTPELIERAVTVGQLDRVEADTYLWSAFRVPERIPARFRGTGAWHGTTVLLGLQERLAAMPAGPDRVALETLAAGLGPGVSSCGGTTPLLSSFLPQVSILETEHFVLEYTPGTITGGLTISDYADALEQAYAVQVTDFGWAPPPGSARYLVRIDPTLLPGLYGFVHAHTNVGDNPETPWHDVDAYISCMAINANFGLPFYPSAPIDSLRSTAAHEFLHSLQFGIGGNTGANAPDSVFIEGSASWMEDEVFDEADDNHYFLWPTFTASMGSYSGSPYEYWVVFRALTERFGTGVAGGGEDIIQDFFELTSQGAGDNLTAMAAALDNAGVSLGEALNDAAIAVWFLRACEGGYALPHCFEEADGYVAASGFPSRPAGTVILDGTATVSVAENFAMAWMRLPDAGPYDLTFANASASGALRVTVACDTGAGIATTPLGSVLTAGGSDAIAGYDPSGCDEVVAAVTNEHISAPNPTSSAAHTLEVSVASV